VTIRDRHGNIAYANQAALLSMGFGSFEELQQRSSSEIMDDYSVEDEHGNPLSIEDVPSMQLMRGRQVESMLMRTINRTTGELNWRHLKTAPIWDDDGEFVAAVTVIEDVTAVKTAEMRTRVLAESGRILASSLDYEETLRNVANLAVPTLADWCAVDLVDEDFKRETSVVAHEDPAKLALAEQLRSATSDTYESESAAARVLRTGTSELVSEIDDEQLTRGGRTDEQIELLRQLNFRSGLVVPLRVPTRTIGLMTLVTAESRRKLDHDDVELAEQLARRAAVAVENARLHTTLADIAETLQQSLLPEPLAEVPGWEVASLYRPAGSEKRIEVGGDFYEVFASGGAWFAVIGDVTGKGVAAAALTGLLRHGSRFASRHHPDPASILAQLDEALRARRTTSLCTALCVRLEPGRAVLSSAGHPPALLADRGGDLREVPEPGPLLGAWEDAAWPETAVDMGPDQLLLLYTDGVTEAVGEKDRYGTDRLKALLEASAGAAPAELLHQLDTTIAEFQAGPRRDDIAALALRPTRG
jgi:PAS domain S-box-containing protein